MSVSQRLRFEVFKRDDFTCTYCGRKVPEVTLEVDYIIPKAEAGGDEYENLTTACYTCNRGKADVPLENKTAIDDLAARTARMREREEQIRAYDAIKMQEGKRIAASVVIVENHWAESYGGWDNLSQYHRLNNSILRRYLQELSVAELLDAVDITVARFPRWPAVKYFGGVLRQKLKNAQEVTT